MHFSANGTPAFPEGLPENYAFTVGDNGVHTFTNGATLTLAGQRTITATDTTIPASPEARAYVAACLALRAEMLNSPLPDPYRTRGGAVPPPAALKEKVMGAFISLEAPAHETFSKSHAAPVRRIVVWQVLAAASVAALIGVLGRRGKPPMFAFYRGSIDVNQYYFYLLDRDFGLCFIKFSSYPPFNIRVWLNGHELLNAA